jgi:cell division protein FtsW (lipid II flippase)
MFLIALALTFSPAARLHTWNTPLRWGHWFGFLAWFFGFILLTWQVNHILPDHDPFLIPILAVLTGWGLITIWRVSPTFGLRQSLWLLVCCAVVILCLRIKDLLLYLKKYKYIWLVSGLLLSALTFFLGVYPGGEGPHLWLGCCGVYFQPSELLKLLLIIFLAAYLADRIPVSFNFWQLIVPSLALFLTALAILFAQHDLGTALIFIVIYITIIFLASNRRRMFVVGFLFMLIAGLLGYHFFQVIHVRVDAWLNPWADPSGRSYQIVQSLLAVASGGVFGRGPGLGSPTIVPIAQSDFITAAIAEEFGLMGTIALFGLLAFFTLRGISLAIGARNQYQRYLAAGITTYLSGQSILIIGGNIRLLPLTGVTLPFVSYGGSSLLISFLGGFILLLISSQQHFRSAPLLKPASYRIVTLLLLAALFALALSNGWWSIIRGANLQTRIDNPRNALKEQYARRGSIFDRNDQILVETIGEIGDYSQKYLYPPLSGTIGYYDPIYGRAGLEDSMNDYLSGVKGNPSSLVWWDHLVYGQFPPGLDLRLAIDLQLQQLADDLLSGHTGALVLMNARSGEIFISSSHPNIDPNQVSSMWASWMSDPTSPLLNRTVQVSYPAGAALAPFLLAFQGSLQASQTGSLTYQYLDEKLDCALPPVDPNDLGQTIIAGCPGSTVRLFQDLTASDVLEQFSSLGFYFEPHTDLAVMAADLPPAVMNLASLYGDQQLHLSPLQMARALSILENGGIQVQPRFVLATNNHRTGWLVYPVEDPQASGDHFNISTLQMLKSPAGSFWGVVVSIHSDGGDVTWYLGGTTADWSGQPYVLSLVLEEDSPSLAKVIGDSILLSAIQP